jgi:hypothetical protein
MNIKDRIRFLQLFLVAVAIAFIFLLPTGIVQAVTNQPIGNNKLLVSVEWLHFFYRIECDNRIHHWCTNAW